MSKSPDYELRGAREEATRLRRALKAVRLIARQAGTPNVHFKKIIARVDKELK